VLGSQCLGSQFPTEISPMFLEIVHLNLIEIVCLNTHTFF
jgi:hypothetical protein